MTALSKAQIDLGWFVLAHPVPGPATERSLRRAGAWRRKQEALARQET